MDDFSIKIRGISEIQKALFQFNAKLAERVTRLALRKGANYMLKEIRNATPVKTGRLKRAIKVKNSRINTIRNNGSVGVYITVSPGKSRNDPKGAWYGKFVETGYNRGSQTVGGRRAVHMGLISNSQLSAKRAFVNSKRRAGRSAAGIRYRYGGQAVEGRHFVLNTFNATAPTALAIMVEASEVAAKHLAQELNLNVTE
ncbi:MAG: HK97-gp10 family putative phage morphogenesis protein [Methylomonas sp.]